MWWSSNREDRCHTAAQISSDSMHYIQTLARCLQRGQLNSTLLPEHPLSTLLFTALCRWTAASGDCSMQLKTTFQLCDPMWWNEFSTLHMQTLKHLFLLFLYLDDIDLYFCMLIVNYFGVKDLLNVNTTYSQKSTISTKILDYKASIQSYWAISKLLNFCSNLDLTIKLN